MWYIIGISVLICSALGQEPDMLPRVTIPQGVVVGSSAENDTHFEFYGIPYADSTAGANRFKAPSEPPLFQQEFIADRQDIKCVRALGVGYEGTEDCLVVNVMTPTLNSTAQLPVMVWVKGKELDKAYIPELSTTRFMEKDVVVVSLNYRESILGFLCLGTEIAPGNAGLKDIIAGLKWVQENIAAFGGDPNNVVLFGHGSGAAAVDLVTVSPMAGGLIHKAISQSGTAISPWAVTRNNLKYAIDVAEALGHTITDIQTLSNVFMRTHLSALMAVINELELTDNSLAFAPCIENPDLEDVEPFLVNSPVEIIKAGQQLQVPFITGFVDVEGTIRAEEALGNNWLQRMEESFSDFIQPDIHFASEEEELNVMQEIKTFYFGDNQNSINIDEYLQYHGDTMILVSAIREAQIRAESSNEVYLYQFSHKGPLGNMFLRPLEIEAAGHNEELAYLFYNEQNVDTESSDLAISSILLERWTNFAKTGTPTSETSSVDWEPFTTENNSFLRILDSNEINETSEFYEVSLLNPHSATITFWDNIYNIYFVDAYSRWDLNERNDDDDDILVVDGDNEQSSNENDEDGSSVEDGIEEETENENGEGGNSEEDETVEGAENENDENESESPNSATSIPAYTFTIVILFTVLDKFLVLQIAS